VTTTSWRVLDHLHTGGSHLVPFARVVTADKCVHLKPDPEPYLRAPRRFGAPPYGAVAIEDSRCGLASATVAGLRCILVRPALLAGVGFRGAGIALESDRPLVRVLSG
jgi:beta-phosphoglucomutase-like phosphatase (HAD superfamily)